MTRSATRSLAQILASNGHDEDDIFVARPIRIADQGAGHEGRGETGAGRFGSSIMRADGGHDFHKINALMALLKPQDEAPGDPTGDDAGGDDNGGDSPGGDSPGGDGPAGPAGDGPRDDGTGPADGGDTAGSGPDTTPTGGTDTPDTDTDPAGDPAGDPGNQPDLVIFATLADDILSGGEGADTFVFGPDGGHDIISNFNVDNDTLDLRSFGFSSVDDVLALSFAEGADLAFALGTARIVLHDVTLAQAADLHILLV